MPVCAKPQQYALFDSKDMLRIIKGRKSDD